METGAKQRANDVRLWIMCVVLLLLLRALVVTHGAVYHNAGTCQSKGLLLKPGETFYKACDKCYCHQFGFFCHPPKKPTSWPAKCTRVPTGCGYHVVYQDNPGIAYRAYSG